MDEAADEAANWVPALRRTGPFQEPHGRCWTWAEAPLQPCQGAWRSGRAAGTHPPCLLGDGAPSRSCASSSISSAGRALSTST
jgi:hypothetical protein